MHRRVGEDRWEGIEPVEYRAGVVKHELIDAPQYRVRVFTVPPGGSTARESHPHDHGVVIVAGRARVTLGEETVEVGPGDSVYVEPDELHCFESLGPDPLGFVCVSPPRQQ